MLIPKVIETHKERQQDQKQETMSLQTTNKMVIVSHYLLIITLSINKLNPPIEKHRMVEQIKLKKIKNNKIQYYAAYKRLF